MRYTVRFANAKYLRFVEQYAADPKFQLPEGVYRGLDVVVEASDAEEALRRAVQELAWPDAEMTLAPMSIASEVETRASMEAYAAARALLRLWAAHGLLPPNMQAP